MNVRIAIVAVCFAVGLHPAAAQTLTPDTAQVAVQVTDVTPDGRLTFSGSGFVRPASRQRLRLKTTRGGSRVSWQPLNAEPDGQVYRTSVPVPAGLAPGAHTLRVTGVTSGRFGRATFDLRWQTPSVHLDVYTGKPAQTLAFTGTGFVPSETIDVSLGDQSLTTITADDQGRIQRATIGIPSLGAGDYTVSFVGHTSRTAVTVGLNIQGFHPWVVLDNYYVSQQSDVGFKGEDFVPGEAVAVYLNSTLSAPVAQVTADGSGRVALQQAVSAANLTGDNTLIVVGQQSQAQLIVKFSVAAQ